MSAAYILVQSKVLLPLLQTVLTQFRLLLRNSLIKVHIVCNICYQSTQTDDNQNCLSQFRQIPWKQTTDVLRGSTLITQVITWCWRKNMTLTSQKPCWHNNKCDCSKQMAIAIFYWKIHKLIYSADKTFRIKRMIDFNRAGPTCYRTNFPYASSG